MDADFLSKNVNGRMLILDISVWTYEDNGYIAMRSQCCPNWSELRRMVSHSNFS